ncbi:MAG: MFS transporter [Muribaculaceae bacterium]|nr:MFS transporter [Muribaculaceae bacterium]
MRSPWYWIPTLYIAEGLPYFAVNTLTVLMYNNLGVSKAEMSFFTGWLYLPWVIKPFWSPFVDLMRTKRWWTVSMELVIALCMAAVAFLLPTGFYFSATLMVFWLMAFGSATHDIAADGYYMLELNEREQAAYVGVRSTFYRLAGILGQGGLVMLAGVLEQRMDSISEAWSITFLILSIFFGLIFIYHLRFLPRADRDRPVTGVSWRSIVGGFGETFVTFFRKPYIWTAISFMLLYRLPEALCIKMVQPFLVDSQSAGGLGLTTAQVGFVNGTVGVIALLAGGVIGGIAVARNGLKRWLWPMAMSLTLPCLVYCYLAISGNNDLVLVCSLIGVEQFGYGFGFTAFMLYLMYFSRGESQTSHYAFCTAFMALGMMVPGMFAGYLYDVVDGFEGFFWLVMASCIFTMLVTGRVYGTLKREY